MCVAIYVPKGVSAPSDDILEQCWSANRDGAGFAYRCSGGGIAIMKGFMTYESFAESFDKVIRKSGYSLELFIHFRIGTAGGNTPGNTHPFPVTSSIKDLKATTIVCDKVMMHNGVFNGKIRNKTISDTMELAIRIKEGCLDNDLKSLASYTDMVMSSSRLAFMDSKDVYLAGDWNKGNGVFYSNMHWLKSFGLYPRNTFGCCSDFFDNGYPKSSLSKKIEEDDDLCFERLKFKDMTGDERYSVYMCSCPVCGNILSESMNGGVCCTNCGIEISYEDYTKCVRAGEKLDDIRG